MHTQSATAFSEILVMRENKGNASNMVSSVTPAELMDIINPICYKKPVMKVGERSCIEIPLNYGILKVHSDVGQWNSEFETELLDVYVEYKDIYFNNHALIRALNAKTRCSTPIVMDGKLMLRGLVSLRGSNSVENIQMLFVGINQDAERVYEHLMETFKQT